MAELARHARVVVIGGGVVGCSVLFHLARRGWKDLLLLERNELTAGSTWHAAGNCPNFSTHPALLRLQAYSTALYRELADLTGYPVNYHVTGSLRLAHDRERMEEYRLVAGQGRLAGLDLQLIGPADAGALYPGLETGDLAGALHDPTDGDIDPAQLTQALARGARNAGARIVRGCPVQGLSQRASGEWEVITPQGTVIAGQVVNAAGYHAPAVGAMMGRQVPSVVLEHQYLVTAELPELAARSERLPLLRDPDESYYLRQERDALLLGPYEHRGARVCWTEGLPEDFSFQLFPQDLERIESYIEAACRRVPLLARAGIKSVVNGPIPYTPDGNPLIGPVPGLRNAFECCVFSFGITQAGGAGKLLADWMVDGEPEWDLWPCDPRRFTAYATPAYVRARALQVYENEYAIAFPVQERPAGRPARTSPTRERLRILGAEFGERGGWERPVWFAAPGDDPVPPPTFGRPGWFGRIAGECRAVANTAGLLDLTGFTRFEVRGPDSARWLDRLICGRLPRTGRVALAYMCSPRGGIVAECTVARLADDRFWLLSAASAEWHDRDWLLEHRDPTERLELVDRTEAYCTLVVAGPAARAVLAPLVDTALDNETFPWLAARPVTLGSARGWALRVNWMGELGWELHLPMTYGLGALEHLLETGRPHGLRPIGLYAQDALRLEKCYPAWKQDLTVDCTPYDAGLGRFVDLGKGDFIGREALRAAEGRPPARRLVPLRVGTGNVDASPGALVWHAGRPAGAVSSAGYGHRVGFSIALAWVDAAAAAPGTDVAVAIGGDRVAARVLPAPVYDPENLRLTV